MGFKYTVGENAGASPGGEGGNASLSLIPIFRDDPYKRMYRQRVAIPVWISNMTVGVSTGASPGERTRRTMPLYHKFPYRCPYKRK